MEWLHDWQEWFLGVVRDIWKAVSGFYHDMSLMLLKKALEVVGELINSIPVPAWMADYSLGHLFGILSPQLGYFVDRLGLGTGLGLIGFGYAFRIARKIATALQW